MYRIVLLDIDGTILNEKDQLEEKLIATVKKLQQKDIIFGLASGRSIEASRIYGEQLGISIYVTYNGSLVFLDNTILHDVKIPANLAYELCSQTNENNGSYIHFSYSTSRSNQPNHHEEHLMPFPVQSNILDTNQSAHRVAIYTDTIHREKIMAEKLQEYVFEEGNRLEVYPKGTKWTGICRVIQHLRISPKEVVTIGNGINDVEMLEEAGLGVAMGNAPSFVKDVADLVVGNHNNHGVASALEKIFKL